MLAGGRARTGTGVSPPSPEVSQEGAVEQNEWDQAGVFCSGSLQPQHQGSGRAMPSCCALFSCLVPTQHQEERRSVKHILFSAWPDHQTPESAGPLLRLVAEVEDSPETAANTGPIVVHCRYVPPPPEALPPRWAPPGKESKQSRPRSYLDRDL